MTRSQCSWRIAAAVVALGLMACGAEAESPIVLVPAGIAYPVPVRAEPALAPQSPAESGARVLVTPARRLDRPTEAIGIVDAHESSGNESAALATLRARAASIGADAVLGVEFRHAEESHEPVHLSGLAVRYLDRNP